MARVSFVEKDQADPVVKAWYQKWEDRGVPLYHLVKVTGHCPYIGLNFWRLAVSILRGEVLLASLRELAIQRVGNLTQSEYESKSHIPMALRVGVRQEQIDEISDWAASAEFNDQERAVLRYTDEVTLNIVVKDDTFANLRSFFTEHQIVELTIVVSFYAMVCRMLGALEVELDPL